MTKRVQILGHIAELANQFVGLFREVTADTDNGELRLHDGETPGGRRFLDRDANDNRYQARSVELDGLLGWEPNQRGFTVRRGPQTYSLRSITVNGEQLTIENGNGYEGNPLIGIAATVTTDHTFSGDITFSSQIAAPAGLLGNVIGNLVGNVTGNLTGNVTGNLTGNANGNHTGSFTGDVDVSGDSFTMADEQILLQWLSPAIIQTIVNAGLPVGSVVAFAGTLEEIPDNWRICDGTNGTPDLRERFIIGVGPDYAKDATGGAETHSHAITVDNGGAHTHTGTIGGTALTTNQLPAHNHKNGVTDQDTNKVFCYGYAATPAGSFQHVENSGSDGVFQGLTSDTGSGDTHTHSLTVDSGGAHNHTATSGASSSLPPYYVLYYIMKGA